MADSIQSPIPNKRKHATVAERFWAKVAKGGTDECWPWTASRVPDGYGKFMVGRSADGKWRPRFAHIVAWELTNGPIPEGHFVCHRCDNPPCVNPRHLFIGTSADNQADMARKDRSVFGEKAPWSKLKNADIPIIKALHSQGLSRNEIARRLGVPPGCIRGVVAGKTWRRAQGLAFTLLFLALFIPPAFSETGVASYYGPTGNRTANGERYDGTGMTCAHRTARFGTRLRVTDLSTGRSIVCRVNDRGPWIAGRVVDLSKAAAASLGIIRRGKARVSIQRLN